jgi:hypothetical protein
MKSTRLLLALVGVACFATACSKSHDHDHKKSGHAEHVHKAPHGGTLVELGDHAYNVELLRDPATGKLTAWILDAHAENFVRIPAPAIQLVANVANTPQNLLLTAVANPATGETVGNTSQFEIQADWLKTAAAFSGTLTVGIKGTKFEKVAFSLPK